MVRTHYSAQEIGENREKTRERNERTKKNNSSTQNDEGMKTKRGNVTVQSTYSNFFSLKKPWKALEAKIKCSCVGPRSQNFSFGEGAIIQ